MLLVRRLLVLAPALLLVPSAAQAGGKKGSSGALGSVTSGVSSKSSSSRGSSSSSSSSSSNTRDHRSSSSSSDDSSGYSSTYSSNRCYDCRINTHARPRLQLKMPKMDFRLAIAMQSVDDSDGAALIDARVTHKGFGFGLATNSYYEDNRIPGAMPETIRMDLWSVYMSARLARTGNTHIDFLGGVAGARSNQFDHLIGGAIGLEVVHRVNPSLSLEGGARYVTLQSDVAAIEYRAGVRAAFVYLGYRSVDFNAGPPLRGPEAGISLQF